MTREQDTAHHDIALRLADAADEVEVGIAPYQAVIRGGRRRKARRWVVGAVAALVIAGSAGSLASAMVEGREEARPAVQQKTADQRHVYVPQRTELGAFEVEVWGAPLSKSEAREQKERMIEAGVWEARQADPVPELGVAWYVVVAAGAGDGTGQRKPLMSGFADEDGLGSDGMGFQSGEMTVNGRPVIVGHVGLRVKRVVYEYDDTEGGNAKTVETPLTRVAGVKDQWFTMGLDHLTGNDRLVAIRLYDAQGKARTVKTD
ncbi:hypothetical protein U9R90_27120 [Streptomyces sp. E11-3]|uniref:hypothetical protein n=1 Tax=Streptomyces sp. E11-3 TaxID=3110112 RepID=UPI00398056F3